MNYSHAIWEQLKSITAGDLANALHRDGWECDMKGGSMQIFLRGSQRVSIHIHPKKTYGPKTLKGLLADIGWTDTDLRRLKLIK